MYFSFTLQIKHEKSRHTFGWGLDHCIIINFNSSCKRCNVIYMGLSSEANVTKSNFSKAALMWFVVIVILWFVFFASLASIFYR